MPWLNLTSENRLHFPVVLLGLKKKGFDVCVKCEEEESGEGTDWVEP